MTTSTHPRQSEKLKQYSYLIASSISMGAFSKERLVTFPCYDSKGRLSIGHITCHPDYVDQENQLCRADLLNTKDNKARVYLNGETFTIHLDSLVENSTQ